METSNKLTGQQLSLWTSSAEDTHVSHSALLENDKGQTTQDISGDGCAKPLANYDPDMQSWKMCEDISLWGDHRLLESLPKSGMTRNGNLYQLHRKVPRTLEKGCSYLPTLSANGMGNTGSQQMLQTLVDSGVLTLEEKKGMSAGNGGRINPPWAEWLMGFPIGWTDLED
jgi:DNA (cytosine-5)-methyltransferase 1